MFAVEGSPLKAKPAVFMPAPARPCPAVFILFTSVQDVPSYCSVSRVTVGVPSPEKINAVGTVALSVAPGPDLPWFTFPPEAQAPAPATDILNAPDAELYQSCPADCAAGGSSDNF